MPALRHPDSGTKSTKFFNFLSSPVVKMFVAKLQQSHTKLRCLRSKGSKRRGQRVLSGRQASANRPPWRLVTR